MSKSIKMTFSNGDKYSVPLDFVAKHRARYYMNVEGFSEGSLEFNSEVDIVMEGGFKGVNWLENMMNWEDVEDVAVRIDEGHVDFQEELCNCEKEII